MSALRVLLAIVALSAPAASTFLRTATCPSTSFQFTMSENAAGTPVWVPQEPMSLPDGQCIAACAASQEGKVKQFRICGPGTFKFSRMTCDRHDYKAVTIEHPNDQFTAGDCKEYHTADYYQIDGNIASVSYTCGAASR